MRLVLALLLAAVANVIVVAGSEFLIHSMFPTPLEGATANMATFVTRMPIEAKLLVLVAWALGSYAAATVALRVSRGVRWTAWAAVVLPIIGVVYSLATIAHPLWMTAIGVVLPPLAAFVASRTTLLPAAA